MNPPVGGWLLHVTIEKSKQPTHEGQHLSVLCRKYGLQKRQIAQLFAV
jgi:hypothetical protein